MKSYSLAKHQEFLERGCLVRKKLSVNTFLAYDQFFFLSIGYETSTQVGNIWNWLQKKAFRILSLCWILRNGLILTIAFNLEFPMRQIWFKGSKDKAESKVTRKIFAVPLFDTTSFLIVMVKLPFLFVISWHLSALPIIWFRGSHSNIVFPAETSLFSTYTQVLPVAYGVVSSA